MRRLALSLLLSLAIPCLAAEARTYAVLSLVGDRLMLMVHQISTGCHIDPNRRVFLDLPAPDLDRSVLRAVDDAVKKVMPDAQVVMLESRDPAIFAAPAKALDDNADAGAILPAVHAIAAGSKATHLILVTKQRREALLEVVGGHVGSGSLEGIGFYIDREARLVNTRTGAGYVGFLSPFAYFRISLIDIASGKLLAEEAVYASTTTGAATALHPWDAMTAKQKIETLQGMLRYETLRVIPIVLKER